MLTGVYGIEKGFEVYLVTFDRFTNTIIWSCPWLPHNPPKLPLTATMQSLFLECQG